MLLLNTNLMTRLKDDEEGLMIINWETTKEDAGLIEKISDRFLQKFPEHSKIDLMMDITATCNNGCPLDLEKLLSADDFNFFHDVSGIVRHINRDNGRLGRGFLPRYCKRN